MKLLNEKPFVILRIIGDTLLIPFSVISAYCLKFKLPFFLSKNFQVYYENLPHHAQVEPYLQGIVYVTVIWMISYAYAGAYKEAKGTMPEMEESFSVLKGNMLAVALMMATTFIHSVIPESRYVLGYTGMFAFIFCGVYRWVLYKLEKKVLQKGYGSKTAIIIGSDHLGQDVAEKMLVFPFLKLRYLGHIDEHVPEKIHYHLQKTFKYLGKKEEIETILQRVTPQVIFMTQKIEESVVEKIIQQCKKKDIELYRLSQVSNFMTSVMSVVDFDGLPFIYQTEMKVKKSVIQFKKITDTILSIFLVTLLSPVFLVIMALIKWVSPEGPVFYCQERVGLNGKPFNMIKFRTMIPDAEKNGPEYVKEGSDSRYIKYGNCLRRYSLDELPQLLNVIKGEMSLIGPRPERTHFVEQYKKEIPYFSNRHLMLGGLTGWAQVNGRSVLTRRPEHKLSYDLYYIKNWSLLLDIKIILKTIIMVSRGEEAY